MPPPSARPSTRPSTHTVLPVALTALALVCGVAWAGVPGLDGDTKVGQTTNGATVLPDNQVVTPVGDRVEITNGRLISSTLSPDGTKLAALTSNALLQRGLTIFDLQAHKVIQQVGVVTGSSSAPLGDGTVAADGPLYSPDGKTLWLSQATDVLRLAVNSDGTVNTSPTATIHIAATHSGRFGGADGISAPVGDALPSGLALSSSGNQLYVAINGNNTLGVIDTETNQLTQQIPVGNAPRQVVVRGGLAWVSDEAGRRARGHEVTNFSDYTRVLSDKRTGAATSGVVSVVDLSTRREVREIPVGLGPAALTLDGPTLFVANTNDDSVSVIDTRTQRVRRTLHVQPAPGTAVGNNVNAILRPDHQHLLLSLGRDNAIADYEFTTPDRPARLLGLIPTDWYPVGIQQSRALGGQLVITSGKGRGARGVTDPAAAPGVASSLPHLTHLETGSVETVAVPGADTLRTYTAQVHSNNGWDAVKGIASGAGDTVASVIPRRIGMPSPIKHVFVIVKENRTYDQVFGDLSQGDGDPAMAEFGAPVTPNMHSLAQRFGILDNFYDPSTLSADGHNWVVQANADDYVESSFGSWARSYPASGSDALAYQRSGFLWERALKAGLSVRNYGEYVNWISLPVSGAPTWADWYKDSQILEGKASGPLPVPVDKYRNWTDVPALNAVTNPAFPLFDLDIPDQYRVDIWHRDFEQAVRTGHLPNLTLMTLMSDHTATSAGPNGPPNPVSEVADNDLALGRMVSEISHSRFWPSSAIFVVEDDSQAGVDHVDGHRAPMLVISPYSKPGLDSTYYTQVNMTRTVEQILGLAPMNQNDTRAVPMYDAFTTTPDTTPYTTQPNQVPLTLGSGSTSPGLGSSWDWLTHVPSAETGVAAAWTAWGRTQHFGGHRAEPDAENPELLNHYDWYVAHGWAVPYPGETRIATPAQLLQPGR